MVYLYLKDKASNYGIKIGKTFDDAKATLNSTNWSEYMKSFEQKETNVVTQRLKAFIDDNFVSWKDAVWENPRKWKNGFEGKILFSDSSSKTISFGSNQNLISLCNKGNMSTALSSLVEMLKNL